MTDQVTSMPNLLAPESLYAAKSNHLSADDSSAGRDGKLRKAAGEFESMLLATLWRSMKTSFATEEQDESDPAHDTLEDWGIQAMSDAVGKNGGLGIGQLILKHLEPKLAAEAQK